MDFEFWRQNVEANSWKIMADGVTDFTLILISFVCGAALISLIYISKLIKSAEKVTKNNTVEKNKTSETGSNNKKPSSHANIKKKHVEKRPRDSKQTFNHGWLMTSLKGHSSCVLDMDFSANGKYLATCGEDRIVFIWSTKYFQTNDHKYTRINIEYDHASLIRWSPDSKAFIVKKAVENVLEIYRIVKKDDGSIGSATKVFTYPQFHKEDIVDLGISSNGKYIMTCSEKTDLTLCDIKGNIITKIDTYLMNNFSACVSPCGKFITASGFAPDVKVWEVQFSKSGEFNQVSRAFELRGHSSGIHQVAFNNDSTRMATVSKDGTWRAYNTNIEYQRGEDPHLIESGKYKLKGEVSRVALSPSGDVIAVANGSSLSIYFTDTGELDNTIDDIYPGAITRVLFDSGSKYILTAGDKHVRIFHNVTGYKATASLARAKLLQSGLSAATKDRLQKQIADSEAIIASLS